MGGGGKKPRFPPTERVLRRGNQRKGTSQDKLPYEEKKEERETISKRGENRCEGGRSRRDEIRHPFLRGVARVKGIPK